MHLPGSVRVGPAIGLKVLFGLLLAVAVACGSPTVTRRVAIVEIGEQAQFDTQTITVTKGDTLKLTVANRTDTPRNVAVDGIGTEQTVEPDAAVTVEIEAERSDTYRVYSASEPNIRPLTIVVPA